MAGRTEESKLLPCPFCGCRDVRLLPQEYGYSTNCMGCEAYIKSITRFKSQAVCAWNRRLAPSSTPISPYTAKCNEELE